MVTFSVFHLTVLSSLTKSIYHKLILLISAHRYLCACRTSIQDSSKHFSVQFTLHSGHKDLRAQFLTTSTASHALLPPTTLCSWPESIQMQRLQKGLSCLPSSSPWPVFPGCCWLCCCAEKCFICELNFSQINSLIQPLSPVHGNSRVWNKLQLAINTQRWVTAETLYFVVHLLKMNYCQIWSAQNRLYITILDHGMTSNSAVCVERWSRDAWRITSAGVCSHPASAWASLPK